MDYIIPLLSVLGPEDEGSITLRNGGKKLQINSDSFPRKL
jgi:hypothetical protein